MKTSYHPKRDMEVHKIFFCLNYTKLIFNKIKNQKYTFFLPTQGGKRVGIQFFPEVGAVFSDGVFA